jgi:hypothetical protein
MAGADKNRTRRVERRAGGQALRAAWPKSGAATTIAVNFAANSEKNAHRLQGSGMGMEPAD